MKVTLRPEAVFTVSVGTTVLGRFRKVSAWESFVKLESEDSPRNFLIVMTEQSRMTQAFEEVWGELFGDAKGSEYGIVAASPDLILKLKELAAGVPVDPCPGCMAGGVCAKPECGRKQSSELMRRYGTVADGVAAVDMTNPDCWAILTPNGSKLVPPDEAKGRKDAYPLYTAETVAAAYQCGLAAARGVLASHIDQPKEPK